jgi:preprotein translocase subunit SecG
MFGSAGATGFLTRLTTFLAVGFFVLTFALAWSAKARNEATLELSLPKASAPVEASELPEAEVPAAEMPASEGAGELPEAP